MDKTKHYHKKKYIYIILFLGLTLLLLYSLFFKHELIADTLVGIGFIIVIYYYDLYHKISFFSFLLLIIAIILHYLGTMGLYSHFIIGIIGYDKLVHLVSSFAVAYAVLQIITEKQLFLKYIFVISIVLGLGAVVEINEFIGTTYLGIDNGGIFTMGDNLNTVKSDLQEYDTYYDMITNFIGALIAVFTIIIRNVFIKYTSNADI